MHHNEDCWSHRDEWGNLLKGNQRCDTNSDSSCYWWQQFNQTFISCVNADLLIWKFVSLSTLCANSFLLSFIVFIAFEAVHICTAIYDEFETSIMLFFIITSDLWDEFNCIIIHERDVLKINPKNLVLIIDIVQKLNIFSFVFHQCEIKKCLSSRTWTSHRRSNRYKFLFILKWHFKYLLITRSDNFISERTWNKLEFFLVLWRDRVINPVPLSFHVIGNDCFFNNFNRSFINEFKIIRFHEVVKFDLITLSIVGFKLSDIYDDNFWKLIFHDFVIVHQRQIHQILKDSKLSMVISMNHVNDQCIYKFELFHIKS